MSIKPTVTRPTTVQDLLAEGPRSWESACALMSDVAAELANGHRRDLTHLALAPAAIALDANGDYDGILEQDEIQTNATTLHYTAPEILVDAAPDRRCDVYSLGAILLALLSGRPPFLTRNSTAQAAIARILHDLPDLDIPGAPPALVALLENSLRKNPEHRTVTAAEFARVTRKLASGATVHRVAEAAVARESAPIVADPPSEGSNINWLAGGVAVALFFGVIFAGAVVAKLADGEDVGLDLVRSEVRPVPDAGGAGSTTSIVIQIPADDRVAGSEAVTAPAAEEPDDGESQTAASALIAALSNASTETSEVIGQADAPQEPAEVDTDVLGTVEEEPAALEIVPIVKSAWDEYELVVGERLDVNVLDNDSLGDREATVSLAADALLPTGFLFTSTGRLAGIAAQCGVTETGYQLQTTDGITSTSILRIVVTGCDDEPVAGT